MRKKWLITRNSELGSIEIVMFTTLSKLACFCFLIYKSVSIWVFLIRNYNKTPTAGLVEKPLRQEVRIIYMTF